MLHEVGIDSEYVLISTYRGTVDPALPQSEVEVIGSKLRYSREFVRRNVLIPPDRTEDLRKLEGIIGADEVAAVVLKRAQ